MATESDHPANRAPSSLCGCCKCVRWLLCAIRMEDFLSTGFLCNGPRPCAHQPVVLIERRGAAGAGPATVCDSEERIGLVSPRHWAHELGLLRESKSRKLPAAQNNMIVENSLSRYPLAALGSEDRRSRKHFVAIKLDTQSWRGKGKEEQRRKTKWCQV